MDAEIVGRVIAGVGGKSVDPCCEDITSDLI